MDTIHIDQEVKWKGLIWTVLSVFMVSGQLVLEIAGSGGDFTQITADQVEV